MRTTLLLLLSVLGCSACASPVGEVAHELTSAAPTLPPERDAAFARAKVWAATQVESRDIKRGPSRDDAFPFLAPVTCDFVHKPLRGHSLKFACETGQHDIVKVKVGESNGEVYGEVAATRLLWALGFGADAMYPVRVTCRGCPGRLGGTLLPSGARLFDPAVIERSMEGSEFDNDPGWSWADLPRVDPQSGGATRAERDALTLLAVFLQHTDNKIEQQRLLCLGERQASPTRDCKRPFLVLDDVGLTFGTANFMNDNALGSTNLRAWAATPVFQGSQGCIGNLAPSFTGTLSNPVIGEEGRQLLATLLARLSKRQIRDLFEVSRVAGHDQAVAREAAVPSIDEWVTTFMNKRQEIASRRCN